MNCSFIISKRVLRPVVCALAAVLISFTTSALDLPTKTVKGRQFYYYKVESGMTIDNLAHKLDLTRAEIVKYNPAAIDGLKKGMKLYFPVDEEGVNYGPRTTYIQYVVKHGDTLFGIARQFGISHKVIMEYNHGVGDALTEGQSLIIPVVTRSADTAENTEGRDQAVTTLPMNPPVYIMPVPEQEELPSPKHELEVAVCMPFMLEEEQTGRAWTHATDFYKGFLLGIDSLRTLYNNPPLRIVAIDTENPDHQFNAFDKYTPILRSVNVIIAPDTPDRLELFGRLGDESNTYVFNTFQVRDTTYQTNPYMIQGNIPANEMYDKVIDYFIANLNGATPVFIDNLKSRRDKAVFTDALGARLKKAGINYKTVKYNDVLTSKALIGSLPPAGVNYIFIPVSGSLNEFKNFSEAIRSYKEAANETATPGRIRLFGYPEYTTFAGDVLDQLKSIGTTYYSRFYSDTTSPSSANIRASYMDRYGTALPEGVPNQALYGFDVARWIIALAAQGATNRLSIANTSVDNGAQMAYRLRPVDGGGFVNEAVYFITLSDDSDAKVKIN